MTAPVYFALGAVIFVREHAPITLERATMIETVHRMNAAHWLGQTDERSLTARLGLAKVEQSLADEMTAAIAQVRAAQSQQKEAA